MRVSSWLAVYGASQAAILAILYPVRRGALRLQWTTDHAVVSEVVSGWTSAERERYRSHLGPDCVHSVVYTVAGVMIERRLRGRGAPQPGWLFALGAVSVAALDLVENAHHARFVRGRITAGDAQRSGRASRAKWLLAAAVVGRLVQLGRRQRTR